MQQAAAKVAIGPAGVRAQNERMLRFAGGEVLASAYRPALLGLLLTLGLNGVPQAEAAEVPLGPTRSPMPDLWFLAGR